MKVILRQNVAGLGSRGDVLNVKTGHARNFLIPKGFVFEYNKGNLQRFELEKEKIKKDEIKNIKAAEELAKKLSDVSVTIKQKAHDNDELYGSVTESMIADELQALNINLDKTSVILENHIKKLGVYDVELKLHSNVKGTIKVWIVKDE